MSRLKFSCHSRYKIITSISSLVVIDELIHLGKLTTIVAKPVKIYVFYVHFKVYLVFERCVVDHRDIQQ